MDFVVIKITGTWGRKNPWTIHRVYSNSHKSFIYQRHPPPLQPAAMSLEFLPGNWNDKSFFFPSSSSLPQHCVSEVNKHFPYRKRDTIPAGCVRNGKLFFLFFLLVHAQCFHFNIYLHFVVLVVGSTVGASSFVYTYATDGCAGLKLRSTRAYVQCNFQLLAGTISCSSDPINSIHLWHTHPPLFAPSCVAPLHTLRTRICKAVVDVFCILEENLFSTSRRIWVMKISHTSKWQIAHKICISSEMSNNVYH